MLGKWGVVGLNLSGLHYEMEEKTWELINVHRHESADWGKTL